jgi:hypothetical protein
MIRVKLGLSNSRVFWTGIVWRDASPQERISFLYFCVGEYVTHVRSVMDIYWIKYYNLFDQRVARQHLCKHGPTCNNRWGCVFCVFRATPNAANGPINSQSDTWHMFSVWSLACNNRGAVFSVCGPSRENMREYGNGNWLHLSSKIPREQQCGQKKN